MATRAKRALTKHTGNGLLGFEVVEGNSEGIASHFASELSLFTHSDEIFPPSFFPLKHIV